MERVSYSVDGHDDIVEVGDGWNAFADANGAPDLAGTVIGRSIWDFVSGDPTRYVYRELLGRVRRGQTVQFPYRCDAPALRRFMHMTMSPLPRAGVKFDSVTLRTETRPIAAAAVAPPAPQTLRMCSWCKRVAAADGWQDLERAVERAGVAPLSEPWLITHTMCPSCVDCFMKSLDLDEAARM